MNSLIIWDIDGPLNPFLSTSLGEAGTSFSYFRAGWNSGWFNIGEHSEWISELQKLPVDMVWGSNWLDECAAVERLLGFPPGMKSVPFWVSPGDTWKLDSVKRFVEEFYPTEKVVWVDDEIGAMGVEWATERGNILIVKSDPRVGWTEEQKIVCLIF